MAIADRVTLSDVGRAFAEAVRAERAARQLWGSRRRDYFELWLVTEPIKADVERRLHAAGLLLHDRFPGTYIRLHVLNPRLFEEFDPADIIPPDAEEIPLRPA